MVVGNRACTWSCMVCFRMLMYMQYASNGCNVSNGCKYGSCLRMLMYMQYASNGCNVSNGCKYGSCLRMLMYMQYASNGCNVSNGCKYGSCLRMLMYMQYASNGCNVSKGCKYGSCLRGTNKKIASRSGYVIRASWRHAPGIYFNWGTVHRGLPTVIFHW